MCPNGTVIRAISVSDDGTIRHINSLRCTPHSAGLQVPAQTIPVKVGDPIGSGLGLSCLHEQDAAIRGVRASVTGALLGASFRCRY